MIKCPACHGKIKPLHMMRGDTLTLYSKDGYFLQEGTCGANKGIVQVTCYNCGYVLKEYKH
ncbi:unnamed protein product [marine sediment metagenome]|uniref:Uncharacterized protein n=1 Tax=marine sediment metagenome TaxID=412755 RepID=X0WZW7_9ZZZZ